MSETGPVPPPEKPPRVRLVQGQEVSLGCGTLILLAIIIALLTQPKLGELAREVHRLHSEMKELKEATEKNTQEIRKMREALQKDRP